jgi:hypothetical protein
MLRRLDDERVDKEFMLFFSHCCRPKQVKSWVQVTWVSNRDD